MIKSFAIYIYVYFILRSKTRLNNKLYVQEIYIQRNVRNLYHDILSRKTENPCLQIAELKFTNRILLSLKMH